jgi:transcription termination factor Rho
MRKEELVEAILRRQEGAEPSGGRAAEPDESGAGERDEPAPRRRRTRRGGRGRSGASAQDEDQTEAHEGPDEIEAELEPAEPEPERGGEEVIEGVVELLPGGAAFVRVDPPEPSDQDVYISAAQVRRCELVSGDHVSGPRRAPRRSERFPSLVRVDTINGRPASEVVDSTRFEDLPAAFPSERFSFDSEDPTIRLIADRLPVGRGSRVTIVGERQSGKTEVLRRLAIAMAAQEGVEVRLLLTGVRPEEIAEWRAGPVEPEAAISMAASVEAQVQAVEGVIEQARRLAARGANAVVLLDTLEDLPAQAARRAIAAARNIVDGGSLTVIATAPAALGGETAVIALDAVLAQAGKFPSIDPEASWTMRSELLGAG